MENITKEVWHIIKNDLAIQKDLARNLINTRALARHILTKYTLKASLNAVISAIRRFERTEFGEAEKKIINLFKDSTILTKNNIACLTIGVEAEKKSISQWLTKNINPENARLITGSKSAKIIADQDIIKQLASHLPEKVIEKIERDLSELTIILNEKATKTKGVLARIANEISLAGINIEETIICPPEFTIYIKQEDILKTHESILKLRQK